MVKRILNVQAKSAEVKLKGFLYQVDPLFFAPNVKNKLILTDNISQAIQLYAKFKIS